MNLIFIWGPAASGKLTVGQKLSQLTGIPLFHNHLVVDALLEKYEFGAPEFVRLREAMWMTVFDTAARSGQPLIFRDTLTDLIFMLRHELNDPSTGPFTITEFDVATSIKDRPMVAIFTYKDLADPTAQKAFSETYLATLIAANAEQTPTAPAPVVTP